MGRFIPPDHSKGDESTLGGYMAVHARPAAFEGSDGMSYSVEILAELPQLSGKVGFQPPDDAWRQRVGAGTGVWLNCALVDLRENRERRTTGVRVERDPVRRVRPPFLLQCHYLLSAWNSAKDSDAVEASVQEHALRQSRRPDRP